MRLALFIPCILFILAVSPAQAQEQTPEQAFVALVANEVIAVVKQNESEEAAQSALEEVFNTYVDIEWVGRFVLGRHWNKASEAQKIAFINSYREFMVGNYTSRLQTYSGEKFDISSPRKIGNDRSVLTMKVYRNAGAPIMIDYKIRQAQGEFKIYDLVVEGISLISTQRSEFDSVVNRKGLDFLISALQKKARK